MANSETIFILDTREAVVLELKNKIAELAATPAARNDRAVAEWLQSIKPALRDALAVVQDKKDFLVRP